MQHHCCADSATLLHGSLSLSGDLSQLHDCPGGSPFRGFWKSAQTGPGQGENRVCGWWHVAALWLAPVRCVQHLKKRSFSGGYLKRGHIALVAKEAYASIRNHYLCTIIYFYIHSYTKYVALNILIMQMLYWLAQCILC